MLGPLIWESPYCVRNLNENERTAQRTDHTLATGIGTAITDSGAAPFHGLLAVHIANDLHKLLVYWPCWPRLDTET